MRCWNTSTVMGRSNSSSLSPDSSMALPMERMSTAEHRGPGGGGADGRGPEKGVEDACSSLGGQCQSGLLSTVNGTYRSPFPVHPVTGRRRGRRRHAAPTLADLSYTLVEPPTQPKTVI
eukprot:101550-Chlamydomonas_euryale.AAC.1